MTIKTHRKNDAGFSIFNIVLATCDAGFFLSILCAYIWRITRPCKNNQKFVANETEHQDPDRKRLSLRVEKSALLIKYYLCKTKLYTLPCLAQLQL